ncbi:MAG: CocE/NonD family hydrolase [Gemmatimonadales bacterium]
MTDPVRPPAPSRPARTRRVVIALVLALAAVAVVVVRGRGGEYQRRELTIPVRDGTRLFAVALVPRHVTGPLPILLVRTPFSAANTFGDANLPAAYRELGRDGYIFVAEDIRGRFGSGGTFVVNRAQNDPRSPPGVNESTDAYDTIDWLVKHLRGNNGRVGVLGISYPGWLAALAGVGAHPALKAISPQAPTADTWLGDDFFHQGAFRQSQGLEFAALAETDPKGFTPFEIPDSDHYDWYLRYPTLDALAKAAKVDRLPSWVGFATHPAYDAYWRAKALQHVLTRPEVPVLFVGGWWDAEDILGPQLAYRTVERADTRGWNHIVLGPWVHRGWVDPRGDSIGPLALGGNTAEYFREHIQRPWFAYWLHGKGDGRFPEAWAFESNGDGWRTFSAWPPPDAEPRELYLRENGKLAFEPPPASGPSAPGGPAAAPSVARGPGRSAAYDAYTSDPAHPVPYLRRPDDGSGWRTWMLQDQRFVESRPDVLSWVSDPLASDLTIAGDVVAHLFASTTGTDADWVVKLIDVFPDSVGAPLGGYELMVNADIMRGRYWKGFGEATPIPANTVTPFEVDLHEQLYRFRAGHRIMVQVQSTWFPLYDRNPQTFVPNIFQAQASNYRAQVHRVWHTARYPSRIEVRTMSAENRQAVDSVGLR